MVSKLGDFIFLKSSGCAPKGAAGKLVAISDSPSPHEDIKGIPTGPRPRPQALRGLSALLGLRLDACHFALNLGHPFLGQRIELQGYNVT